MKKNIYLCLLALCTLLLNACTAETELAGTAVTASTFRVADYPAFGEPAATRSVGIFDAGKTAWENGDKILLCLTRGSEIDHITLSYAGSAWTADQKVQLADDKFTLTAWYAPDHEWTVADATAAKPSIKSGALPGTSEYLEATATGTTQISFSAKSRTYSRLRIVTAAKSTLSLQMPGFKLLGTESVLGETEKSLTADAKGNIILYGSWTDAANLKISTQLTISGTEQTISLIDKTVAAASTIGTGYVADARIRYDMWGEGTAKAPYLLRLPQQLYIMNNNNAEWVDVVTDKTKVFQLANDITLGSNWAVGSTKDFCCTLDGAGHTLTVSSAMNAGFFSKLGAGAVIKDLNLKLAGITSSKNYYTGGLADEVAGTVSIDNVHVSGTAVDSEITVSVGEVVGGLIGYVNGNLTLTRSSFNMNIAGTLIDYHIAGTYAGGLVGKSPKSDCKLTMVACYSTGNISTDGNSEGGLIGATVDGVDTGGSQFNIQSCYSTCAVSRTGSKPDYGTGRLCGVLTGKSSADIFSYNVSTSSKVVEILTDGYHPSALEGIGDATGNQATHTGNAVGVANGDVYGKLTANTTGTVVILEKTYYIKDLWTAVSGSLSIINMDATPVGTAAE